MEGANIWQIAHDCRTSVEMIEKFSTGSEHARRGGDRRHEAETAQEMRR